MEAWYAIQHMREYVQDEHDLVLIESLKTRAKTWRTALKKICTIIHKDACT
jgi:predicted P-loop ATPase/GTPase